MESLLKSLGNSCTVKIKNNTMPMATLPTGMTRYIENPITTKKPSPNRIEDSNTLIHSVVHTYRPGITEPIIFHYHD